MTSQKMMFLLEVMNFNPAMVAPKRINVGNQKVDGISKRERRGDIHDNHGYLMIVHDNYPQ